jgi:hypothetical protein
MYHNVGDSLRVVLVLSGYVRSYLWVIHFHVRSDCDAIQSNRPSFPCQGKSAHG